MPAHTLDMQSAAAQLHIGPRTLFKRLRDLRILNPDNSPRTQYIRQGYFKCTASSYCRQGETHYRPYQKTLVTLAGLDFLQQLLRRETLEPGHH